MNRTPDLYEKRLALCNALAESCKEAGMSHRELAERLGIHESTISKLFKGKFNPGMDVILLIAQTVQKDVVIATKK